MARGEHSLEGLPRLCPGAEAVREGGLKLAVVLKGMSHSLSDPRMDDGTVGRDGATSPEVGSRSITYGSERTVAITSRDSARLGSYTPDRRMRCNSHLVLKLALRNRLSDSRSMHGSGHVSHCQRAG
jgi:hypothetical protein